MIVFLNNEKNYIIRNEIDDEINEIQGRMEAQEITIDIKQKKLSVLIEEYMKQPFTSLENLIFQDEKLRSQTNLQILMRKLIHKFISVLNSEMYKTTIVYQKNLIILDLQKKVDECSSKIQMVENQYQIEIRRINNKFAEKEFLLLNQVYFFYLFYMNNNRKFLIFNILNKFKPNFKILYSPL